jgi:hypothetical protein
VKYLWEQQKILSKKVVKKMVQAFYDRTVFFLKASGFRYNQTEGRELQELFCYSHISGLVYSAVIDGRWNTRENYRNLIFFLVHIYDL